MNDAGNQANRANSKLHKDQKHRNVHYDCISKKGYVVQNKDLKLMSFLSIRYVIAIYFGIMLYFLHFSWGGCLVAAIVIGILAELYYRFSFLNKLEVSEGFVPEKISIIDRFGNIGIGRIIFNSVICVACSVILIANLLMHNITLCKVISFENMDISLLFLCSVVLVLACLALLIIQMYIIVSKRNNKVAARKSH